MKILYITRKYPPSIGGMQTHSYEFYNALREKEEVYLISWDRSQRLLLFFLIIATFKGTYYILKYNVDVIQVGDLALSPIGLLFKRIFDKKVLTMAHGKDTSFNNFIYRHIVFKSVKKLDGIICISNFLKQRLSLKGIKPDKLFTNPYGIDCSIYKELFNKDASKKQIGLKYKIDLKGKKVLLSVSRFVKKKGIANFVKNMLPEIKKSNPDMILLLVGKAESREAKREQSSIIAMMEQYGLKENILFLGNVYDRKVFLRQIYSSADIFIMPNQHIEGDYEGFGLTTLEASMNEVPVVAFSINGIPSAVKNGENGILIREGDNEGFTRAVQQLLNNENERAELGKRAKNFVSRNYNWTVTINKYIEILKQAKN